MPTLCEFNVTWLHIHTTHLVNIAAALLERSLMSLNQVPTLLVGSQLRLAVFSHSRMTGANNNSEAQSRQ